jgi:hypothetical protein
LPAALGLVIASSGTQSIVAARSRSRGRRLVASRAKTATCRLFGRHLLEIADEDAEARMPAPRDRNAGLARASDPVGAKTSPMAR